MCTTCGCGGTGAGAQEHGHSHEPGHSHELGHEHRLLRLERDILHDNAHAAAANRQRFEASGTRVYNLMSSPGAGKTTLLVDTIARLGLPVVVIEGDQQTELDADRIRAAGAPAYQVNTGKACHLDAKMVAGAADHLELPRDGVLFVENVGNLVCPAAFDLGEHERVLLVSVTEGDDKPLKYPDMFRTASLLVVTKIDLLPHVRFDLAAFLQRAHQINPGLESLQLSVFSGEGLEAWFSWLRAGGARRSPRASASAAP